MCRKRVHLHVFSVLRTGHAAWQCLAWSDRVRGLHVCTDSCRQVQPLQVITLLTRV